MLTWEELGVRSTARQFPHVEGRDAAAVVETLHLTGPVQSQTARSPYLGLAARLPGIERDTISAAYEEHQIVRGSSIRGTVHTSTPADHTLLEVATRVGQRAMYARSWRLQRHTLEEAWAAIEDYAHDDWHTADAVKDFLAWWLAEHEPDHDGAVESGGRYLAYGHGGLVRRPMKGGWEGQGKAGYRTATALLGDRAQALADPDGSLDALVQRHLACHGPASRQDLAWWSGLGLRVVDAVLARLAPALTSDLGPDDRTYYDLPQQPAATTPPDVRLLPEFDATLCAYDPQARDRFVDPDHFALLWNQKNALINAPLMVDGRLTGAWRLEGSGARRRLEVRCFPRTRRPRKAELERPAAALQQAYGVSLTGVEVSLG